MIHSLPIWAMVAIGVALALEIYHGWGYLQTPQFWGEEGKFFYKEAYEGGLRPLLNTCGGYLHVFPRTMSFIATLLPMLWAPQLAMLSALLGQVLLYLLVWSPRLSLPMPARVLCTLAVALNPNGGEVVLSLTNVQWYLGPALLLVLLREPPRQSRELLQDAVWLLVLGTTGPYIVLFLPLAALARLAGPRPISSWERWRWGVGLAVALGHLAFWRLGERQGNWASHLETAPEAWLQAFSNLLLPFALGNYAPWFTQGIAVFWLGIAAAFFVVYVLLLFPNRAAWREPLRLALLACGGICYAAGLWERRDAPQTLHPYGHGQRSFFILYIAVAWMLVLTLTSPTVRRSRRWAAGAVLAISAVCSLAHFDRIMGRPDYNYPEQVRTFQQRGRFIFTQPPRWTYELDQARYWRH